MKNEMINVREIKVPMIRKIEGDREIYYGIIPRIISDIYVVCDKSTGIIMSLVLNGNKIDITRKNISILNGLNNATLNAGDIEATAPYDRYEDASGAISNDDGKGSL